MSQGDDGQQHHDVVADSNEHDMLIAKPLGDVPAPPSALGKPSKIKGKARAVGQARPRTLANRTSRRYHPHQSGAGPAHTAPMSPIDAQSGRAGCRSRAAPQPQHVPDHSGEPGTGLGFYGLLLRGRVLRFGALGPSHHDVRRDTEFRSLVGPGTKSSQPTAAASGASPPPSSGRASPARTVRSSATPWRAAVGTAAASSRSC